MEDGGRWGRRRSMEGASFGGEEHGSISVLLCDSGSRL